MDAIAHCPISDLDRIGGLSALEGIMRTFVSRLTGDIMIGYFFARTVPQRLIAQEVAHAASHLAAPHTLAYTGRSMAQAHARRGITGGHFARRRRILQEVLSAHGVPDDVAERWVAYQESLRSQVVGGSVACPSDD